MTSGFGVDPTQDVNGNPTSGTSAQDIRKIWGGLFPTPGIISGCNVTTSSSSMQYTVSSGVVAIPTATGEVVLAPVPATTVLGTAAPVSGTRIDTVYVQQRYPDIEGDSEVVVKVGIVPQRALAIKSFLVSAGNTTSSQTIVTGVVNYAIPYGASLGILKQHRSTSNFGFTGAGVVTSQSVYVPTDRLVRISLLTSLSAQNAVKYDAADYCEVYFDVYRNGARVWRWNTPGLSQAWAQFYWSDYMTLTAGTHTISYNRGRASGPGTPFHHYAAGVHPGSLFSIEDVGPVT